MSNKYNSAHVEYSGDDPTEYIPYVNHIILSQTFIFEIGISKMLTPEACKYEKEYIKI